MVRHQVTKLANPRHRLSPKQIKYFGTKRQRAAQKAARKRAKPAHATAHRPRTLNPAWVVTLGSNPRTKRRTKPVAAPKRKRNRSHAARNVRHHRRAASNPRRHHRRRTMAVNRPRRRRAAASNTRHHRRRTMAVSNPRRRRARSRNPRKVYYINWRKRNPTLFGSNLFSKDALKLIGGGFVGLIGAKFLPTLVPASMAGSFMTSTVGKVVVTGVAGYLTSVVAGKVAGTRFGEAALFGAIIQTASVALNAFIPSLYQQLGIGLGDFVPGRFSVPQNPLLANQKMRQIAAPSAPASSMMPTGSVPVSSGLGRAYPAAY